jgi:hypothetical protein
MNTRCLNPKNEKFKSYGGRGIKVCDRWMIFANFLEDMGQPPPGMTLERKDVNGNYELSNCKWATAKEQCNNRQKSVVLNGVRMSMAEASRLHGKSSGYISTRLYMGHKLDDVLTQLAGV